MLFASISQIRAEVTLLFGAVFVVLMDYKVTKLLISFVYLLVHQSRMKCFLGRRRVLFPVSGVINLFQEFLKLQDAYESSCPPSRSFSFWTSVVC